MDPARNPRLIHSSGQISESIEELQEAAPWSLVSTFLAHVVTDAPHQQAPPRDTDEEDVARLKLQEQSSLLEIFDLRAALQNTQKEARRERRAIQHHVERQQARLLLAEEKCVHFKALSVRQEKTVTELRNENTALRAATVITADSLVTLAST